ncbi:DUF305 domain-containing protein [Streptomyces spiramenti]|uniref:DUF305 domain-containing protein n=1 Tax=Streptomyces spiramenti TaxID=2720606 RepID=A0ABX1ALX2_9ACTN|nr:DUF305 domain-containing protein [Streptomyces spiramenti]NJP68107.1 DUF305 domain-containing protein [Streptomyces spiramenti]
MPRRARRVATAAAAALLTALPLAGCGAEDDRGAAPAVTPVAEAPAAGATDPASVGGEQSAADGLSGTDLAWLQLMAPMNDRTLLLLELVEESGTDAELGGFAGELAVSHAEETTRLREILDDAGVPDTNPHEGHNMTGMVTDDELSEIAGASDVDAAARDALHEHLAQSAMVSGSAAENGSDEATTALAAELAETREGQLATLEALAG